MNLLENLNKEQLSAVLHQDGPLLIVAGAGTGKTTVITQRIAYLIEQELAGPDEILALTFTEKAAGEMADRAGALLPYGYFDLWISTFHGLAERILKEHGLSVGLPGDFKLLNEFEQWALVKKNLDKFELDYYRPLGNPTKFIQALLKHFSRAKDEDVSPAAYLEYADGLRQDSDRMLSGGTSDVQLDVGCPGQETARVNEIANAYHVYQQLLLDNNVLDFGDLINYCLKLFRERPAILEKYRRQFKYILVDEFQDTNWAQYELIKMLAAPKNNLTVVADDDQSVYRFRGASMSNILQFNKDYSEAEKIILVKNYRSAQNILDLSYEFIKQNNPNRLEWQLGKGLNKKLSAENKGRGEVKVIQGADLSEEVKLAVDKIVELEKADKAATWNDFAILVRANDAADVFMAELDRRGLPYIFGASRGLYLKPVIMDAIAYFKLLDNYHESPALWRVLNLPIFNFSERELIDLNHLASKKAWSLYETISQAGAFKLARPLEEKIKPVLALVSKHSALAREGSVSQVLLAFLNDSGYLKRLTEKDEQKNLAILNWLNQFLKRVQEFEAAGADKSVKAFLAELELEMQAGEQGELAPDLEAGPEAIKILTVHGAKGLEFKYVFIANLVDKRFPTTLRREQIELPAALVKEILPQGDIHLQEERRLFYVAMTRAKQGLYFSWAPDYGGKAKKKPSRFLMELGLEENSKLESHKKTVISSTFASLSAGSREKSLKGEREKYKGFLPSVEMTIVPAHFSYSQLAAYSVCPYQYRFAHVLKIPVRGKEQFSFGKTLHSTLQKLFALLNEKKGLGQNNLFDAPKQNDKKIKISLEEILGLYEQSWIDDWYESSKKKQERKQQGKEILQVFYDKHKDSWPEVLFLEKGFNWKISDGADSYAVRGVIDRIDRCPSAGLGRAAGLKLVDYKTGGAKKNLIFEEKEQLLIYQLAVSELFKEPVAALAFYYLDDNSEVEFLGTAKDLAKIKAKIIDTIKQIRQGQFSPRPSQLCAWCDYRGICDFKS